MAPSLLFDLSAIDLNKTVVDVAGIEAVNPQRGDMRHLDGINWISDNYSAAVGYKDVRDDEFWVPGHIPGRPLLPGVLMIEAAAQLAGYLMWHRVEEDVFLGFLGVDHAKFRGQVAPGQRLTILGHELKMTKRRFLCVGQGVVDGNLVFECKISGMPL